MGTTTDQHLVSTWSNLGSLPESYVFPPEKRPGKVNCPRGNTVPTVDLSHDDRTHTIQQIMKASQEFGFFQVINHGVCEDLMDATMGVIEEFNAMPEKEKVLEGSRDPDKSCWLYTSSGRFESEEVHCWRDALMHHPCHPLDKYIQFWPRNPKKIQVVGTYIIEVRRLSGRILEMICEGMGLEPGFFGDNLSENPMLLVNHYPPCPDPTLTLGITKHYDPSVVTIVLQGDVSGLQVFKDQEWIGVEPIAHALVVNIGHVLQIISNGKLKSAEHPVVTNSDRARTTASFFVNPSEDAIIEPARTLVNVCDKKPMFRAVEYGVFKEVYLSTSADAEAVNDLMSPSS